MKTPKAPRFEIICHGVDHAQYFPGCGVAFSDFDACATGCGSDALEAYSDALNQIYESESETVIDWLSLPEKPRGCGITKRVRVPASASKHDDCELYVYVTVRYKKPIFERIVFMQGENADEALQIYDNRGAKALLAHLQQWEYPGEHETAEEPAHGAADDVYRFGAYIVSVNQGLNYCGLERETTESELTALRQPKRANGGAQ